MRDGFEKLTRSAKALTHILETLSGCKVEEVPNWTLKMIGLWR